MKGLRAFHAANANATELSGASNLLPVMTDEDLFRRSVLPLLCIRRPARAAPGALHRMQLSLQAADGVTTPPAPSNGLRVRRLASTGARALFSNKCTISCAVSLCPPLIVSCSEASNTMSNAFRSSMSQAQIFLWDFSSSQAVLPQPGSEGLSTAAC